MWFLSFELHSNAGSYHFPLLACILFSFSSLVILLGETHDEWREKTNNTRQRRGTGEANGRNTAFENQYGRNSCIITLKSLSPHQRLSSYCLLHTHWIPSALLHLLSLYAIFMQTVLFALVVSCIQPLCGFPLRLTSSGSPLCFPVAYYKSNPVFSFLHSGTSRAPYFLAFFLYFELMQATSNKTLP